MQMPYLDKQQRQDANRRRRGLRGATRPYIHWCYEIAGIIASAVLGFFLAWILASGI